MTSVKQIKVPEGCIKMASHAKMREEVISFLKLKTVNQHGYFCHGSGVKQVSKVLGITDRTIRRWFIKLCNCGLMYKDDNGYGLVKYDKMFEIIGFDITKHKRKKRLGKFKIFKIHANSVNHLLTEIAREELSINQRSQAYMAKRKLTQISKPDETVGVKNGVSLSCAGLARLLGYKKSTGHRIEKKLLDRFPNSVIIDKHVEVVDTQSRHKTSRATGNGYYWDNGVLFKVVPNRIYIL